MKITHINPDGLYKSPVFSQAVVIEGGKTVYIGGQNGILPDGTFAGDDFATQTKQACRNVLAILAAIGADQGNVAKLTIYMARGQDIQAGYAAAQEVWGNSPTAISALVVESLAVPGALVEIDAVAAIEA
jgi:enamine deaminase RidA (YjgF/YER057c/UK114 family)